MVAGEEKIIAIQQRRMPAGVAWRRDGQEARRQLHPVAAVDHNFRIRLRRFLQLVDDALAPEFACVLRRIGYIVPMREKDTADTAGLVELLHQVTGPARRIDQPVTLRMPNEVARTAEGLFGCE